MLSSAIPARFPVPFANAAGGAFIHTVPTASQIGITDGAASLTDGFVPLNFSPISAGGVPPFGQDVNGLLKQVTQWNQWQAAGGPVFFDATFNTAIGGYPKQAVLASATTPGLFFMSTADNNTNNPDSVLTNWTKILGPAALTNAMLAVMAAGTVKANLTGGAATPSDVTLASLFSAMVGNDSVTNAILANMGALTIKANPNGSAGDPQDVSPATLRGMIGDGAVTGGWNFGNGMQVRVGSINPTATGQTFNFGTPFTTAGIAVGVFEGNPAGWATNNLTQFGGNMVANTGFVCAAFRWNGSAYTPIPAVATAIYIAVGQ